MTAPLLDTTWAIGGIVFNATDANGVEWIVTGDDGWWNGPAEKLNMTERPAYDGSFDAPSFAENRLVTLDVTMNAPSRTVADIALRQLAAVGVGALSQLTVTEPAITTYAMVRRAQKPGVVRVTQTYADIQLYYSAPDPRRYGTNAQTGSTTTPSSVSGLDWATGGGLDWATGGGLNWGAATSTGTFSLANPGTAESWPTWTLLGPLTNPVLTNQATGQQLAYNATLASGDTLVIATSPYGRSVLLNGSTDRRAFLVAAQWFAVAPGTSVVAQLSTSSSLDTGSASGSVNPAYW